MNRGPEDFLDDLEGDFRDARRSFGFGYVHGFASAVFALARRFGWRKVLVALFRSLSPGERR